MKTRAITGFFFVAVMLASILLGSYLFTVFFLLLSILATDEFFRLVKTSVRPQRMSGYILAGLIFTAVAYHYLYGGSPELFLAAVPVLTFIYVSELYRNHSNPFHNIAYTLFGVIYAAVPFCFFYALAFSNGEYSSHLPLAFLIMLWASDTGAYLFGSRWGKHKLFERHSPKKTWEGFFGGLLVSVVAALIISRYFEDLGIPEWVGMSLIIVTVGTLGDLAESMLKRSLSAKDSGSLLPGHGGVLDRFDGLLLSAPLVFVYLQLLRIL
jgi:phosphatidate cytidylyltransferase